MQNSFFPPKIYSQVLAWSQLSLSRLLAKGSGWPMKWRLIFEALHLKLLKATRAWAKWHAFLSFSSKNYLLYRTEGMQRRIYRDRKRSTEDEGHLWEA